MYQFHSFDNSEAPLFKTDSRDAPDDCRLAVAASRRASIGYRTHRHPADALRDHLKHVAGIGFVFHGSLELEQYTECVRHMIDAVRNGLHSGKSPSKTDLSFQSGA